MLDKWFSRHRNRRSLTLHAVGIPLTIAAIPCVVVGAVHDITVMYIIAAALFIIGYTLQFVGHAIVGNDAGEMILVKKLLGRPYIAVVDPPEEDKGPEQ